MSIAITEATAEVITTTNGTSYSFAAFTPSANSLIVVMCSISGATFNPVTISGGSLNWVTQFIDSSGTGNDTGYLFWAKVGDSPISTTISLSFTNSCSGCMMTCYQVTGYDAQTPNPLRQYKINSNANSTNANVTFDYSLDTNNGYIAQWVGTLTANSSTPPTGWTEVSDGAFTNPARSSSAAYRATGETGTNISFTNATTGWWMQCIEIYADGYGVKQMASLGIG